MSLKKIYDLLIVNLDERGPNIELSKVIFPLYFLKNIVDDSRKYALLIAADIHSVGAHGIAFATFL